MRDKINDDLKTAMKAGDKDRVGTLRLINSAIKSADIEARPSGKDKVSDGDILTGMAMMISPPMSGCWIARRIRLPRFYSTSYDSLHRTTYESIDIRRGDGQDRRSG